MKQNSNFKYKNRISCANKTHSTTRYPACAQENVIIAIRIFLCIYENIIKEISYSKKHTFKMSCILPSPSACFLNAIKYYISLYNYKNVTLHYLNIPSQNLEKTWHETKSVRVKPTCSDQTFLTIVHIFLQPVNTVLR